MAQVGREPSGSLLKSVLENGPLGKGPLGRLKLRWDDKVK